MLKWAGRHETVCDAMRSFLGTRSYPSNCLGCDFPIRWGWRQGWIKNAEALPAWAAMGFGFTELGAATWHAQPGNPAPRVFRAIPEEAIVNRMGFNNLGAEAIAEKLAGLEKKWALAPASGRHESWEIEDHSTGESRRGLREFLSGVAPHLDFFVVNVSSPNTPNLRQLQDKRALDEIFSALQEVQADASGSRQTPILVKVAPDLSFEALDEILELVGPRQHCRDRGDEYNHQPPVIKHPDVKRVYAETGGLSGRPLRARSTEVMRHLYQQTKGKLPIIGVGGIFTAADAWEKIAAGASLVAGVIRDWSTRGRGFAGAS